MPDRETPGLGRHVTLGTLSFAVCFAAWGLISAFAPRAACAGLHFFVERVDREVRGR